MSQNQPPNQFHISHLIAPTLGTTIRALSDRGGQTEAQRQVRADDALNQIMSFQPRDVVDMTLAAQTMVFHELLADSARDVLRGVDGPTKLRGLSTLLGVGRLTQGHVDRLHKRGNRPYQTEPVASLEPVASRAAPPVTQPAQAARPAQPAAATRPEPEPVEPPYKRPVEPESWLDEPFEQWVLETPAAVAQAALAEVIGEAIGAAMGPAKPPPRNSSAAGPSRVTASAANAETRMLAAAD